MAQVRLPAWGRARNKGELPGGARLADYLTVGYLAMNCPLEKVRAALAANGVQSKRQRGLPRETLVYFVMAMCLYANVAYEEVLRLVLVHAAIRRLMTQAAAATNQAAEDLSFVHAVRALKRRLPSSAAIPP